MKKSHVYEAMNEYLITNFLTNTDFVKREIIMLYLTYRFIRHIQCHYMPWENK